MFKINGLQIRYFSTLFLAEEAKVSLLQIIAVYYD